MAATTSRVVVSIVPSSLRLDRCHGLRWLRHTWQPSRHLVHEHALQEILTAGQLIKLTGEAIDDLLESLRRVIGGAGIEQLGLQLPDAPARPPPAEGAHHQQRRSQRQEPDEPYFFHTHWHLAAIRA